MEKDAKPEMTTRWVLGLLLVGTCLLLLNSWRYYPFFSDDAFISLRYADRLLDGKGLTWNDGERVEGYSNLLWVLCTAALGLPGTNLVFAGRIVCIIGSITALLGILLHCKTHHPRSRLGGVTATVALATCGSLAIWTLGGLEATLHATLICWTVIVMGERDFLQNRKRICSAGILLGLLALNRPDGALLTGAALAAAMFLGYAQKHPVWPRVLLPLAIIPALFAVAQTAGRLLYYHDLFPNTYYAKFALTSHRFETGITYLSNGALTHSAVLVPILVGAAALALRWGLGHLPPTPLKTVPSGWSPTTEETETLRRVVVGIIFLGGWACLVFLGGGDIFPGWRHLVPVIPLSVLLLSDLIATAEENTRVKTPEIWVLAVVIAFGNLAVQWTDKENLRAKGELWSWLGKVTGEHLKDVWGTAPNDPLVAVSSAGALSFYSKLPILDMFGLNDRNLTRNRPEGFGQGIQAHELLNIPYVLGRKPDIIISHVGGAVPEFDMINNPEFKENYELVLFPYNPEGEKIEAGFKSHAWVRKEKLKELLKNAPDVEIVGWKYWEKETKD